MLSRLHLGNHTGNDLNTLPQSTDPSDPHYQVLLPNFFPTVVDDHNTKILNIPTNLKVPIQAVDVPPANALETVQQITETISQRTRPQARGRPTTHWNSCST